MICIKRYIGDTTLTGTEYLLKANSSDVKLFPSEDDARKFLTESGIEDENLDDFIYEEYIEEEN